MSEKLDKIRALRRELAKGLNLVKFDVLRAYAPAHRKESTGVRIGYFKPRFVKKGDEYKYARSRDGLTTDMDMPQSIGGNMSYAIVDPESISRRISQSKLRKYHAGLRVKHAASKVDKIEVTLGLTKKQLSQRKREAYAWQYMK